jgi:glutathione reductase (NADPH)
MAEYDVDLFVIGAGSGGVRASRVAAQYGARVMIAEEYRVGGTCVIRGCVPKKLLVYASRYSLEFEDAAGFGWTVSGAKFDWPTLIANKDKEIARLEAAYRANLARLAVEIVETRAVVEDAHTVRLLKTGARVRAEMVLLANGAHPVLPQIPGVEHAITSNEAFHLTELPRRIVIQGGGYIAMEFACLFHGLGADVTLVHRGDEILRGFDDDVRRHLRSEMVGRGIKVILGQSIASIKKKGHSLQATLANDECHPADQVMFAIGRVPNTKKIGLE